MNHYEVLGIDQSASQKEIKQAYRALAQNNHPDKGGDAERFQSIQAAYDILGDEGKRARYDRGEPEQRSAAELREQQAIAGMMALMSSIVDQANENNIENLDLRKAMITAIGKGIDQTEIGMDVAKATLRKLKKMKKRLRAGEFIFSAWIQQKRTDAVKAYRASRDNGKIGARMLELAETVDYDFVEEPQRGSGYFTFSTGTPFA